MPKQYTLTFTGDVMLARLIDQLYKTHLPDPHSASIASYFKESYQVLDERSYNFSSPWGTTLPLLQSSDLTLINLETAATTSFTPWPGKAFNYRMHPANLGPILQAAGVDYVGLANNHTLDFGVEGLLETIRTVGDAGVGFAGAGVGAWEACKPAVLGLAKEGKGGSGGGDDDEVYEVHVYAAADHPEDWREVEGFHFIDYTDETREELRELLTGGVSVSGVGMEQRTVRLESSKLALKIFSVHWGPNYRWEPGENIRGLARFLIDECEVDIVHGHSSHHVQGVEVYRGKLIIYGCGDFVDDYVLHEEYRNDLGAVWRVIVKEDHGEDEKNGLVLDRLEIFPTRIERFRAMLLGVGDGDNEWVRSKIGALSRDLGTLVRDEVGSEVQIVVDIDH
jgi:poly-gamma-glutamate capsule biosynthesis protein CapA/YwtB (metallophosphatase superfamily)